MGVLGRALDPLNIIGLNKKKKSTVFVPTPTAAKQGSQEEVTQRRLETANRLRSQRTRPKLEEEDEFPQRGAKLFGE